MTAKEIKQKITSFSEKGDIESLAYIAGQLDIISGKKPVEISKEEALKLIDELDYKIQEFYSYDAMGCI